MRNLQKHEQTAIEAVARHFSATWEKSNDAGDAYILIAGKRVAVDFATLRRRGLGQGNAATPRLRFDKVATRLIERLKATVSKTATNGRTVFLTITAPIRLPSKTAASLEDKVKTLLGRSGPGRDVKDIVHGNRVQIRMLSAGPEQASKLIGFVHNPDSDPLRLFNMTSEVLELTNTGAGRRMSGLDDRWLIVITPGDRACLETYRYIYSQLSRTTEFSEIFMVFVDGRVGKLTGEGKR